MTIPWQPGNQGVTVVPPGYNDPHNYSSWTLLLVASTGLAGVALVNGSPTLLSWTAPNDGQMHSVIAFGALQVSSAETGGAIGLGWTQPGGQVIAAGTQMFAGGLTTGPQWISQQRLVAPGSTVTVAQSSALTVGAATVWAEIWAA